jgi:O-antigen ligase
VASLVLVATLSLAFTERLDVATNEWRVVVVEPALFYLLLRLARLADGERWAILDAFVAGAVVMALFGHWEYFTGRDVITVEDGLYRLRSVYGSPNNVALYLGRVIPLLVAFVLLGRGRRRWAYGLALIPTGLAMLLTFSKGAFFFGLPAALLAILVYWRRALGRPVWPWLLGVGMAGLLFLVVALQFPQLAARLDPRGLTGALRLNLWRSAVAMFFDHPLFGAGLDNFLYAYRGRYLLDAAWQDPNLSHPHNLVLDFATRLGLAGLLAGFLLFASFWQTARRLPAAVPAAWRPVAIGLLGAFAHTIAHGLVDHSFFLVDLAFSFLLVLALAIRLEDTHRRIRAKRNLTLSSTSSS